MADKRKDYRTLVVNGDKERRLSVVTHEGNTRLDLREYYRKAVGDAELSPGKGGFWPLESFEEFFEGVEEIKAAWGAGEFDGPQQDTMTIQGHGDL